MVAADVGRSGVSGAYKTINMDTNLQRFSEDDIQLVTTGTEIQVTHRSETETMSGRTPDLTGTLPPILRLSRTKIVGPSTSQPNTARQQCQSVPDRTSLEECPGVDVDKIHGRRGMLPEHREG